ncbi:MAG TPA: exodeoxyribonuclease III [Methylotenera sp.]|nr:exodeoxyribonuclease III [Methylotenera sp.]
MKFATWNVNSLNVRLDHLLNWLRDNQPDVVCLQETKQEDSKFPYDALKEAGYEAVHIGQKTYNGVAILSRHPITNLQRNIPGFDDEQQRVIAADIGDIRVVCAYFPNGQAVDSDKYHYKLRWVQALTAWLKTQLAEHPKLLLLGDYNIAPEDQDCHDPSAWIGQVLVSPAERQAFKELVNLGLHDSFRLFEQPEKSYSWWDYRMLGFRRNFGLRIDHILVSDALKASCKAAYIDKNPRRLERPSDHTPVILELN